MIQIILYVGNNRIISDLVFDCINRGLKIEVDYSLAWVDRL